MGNDTPLSVVRENIVGSCDEIIVWTARMLFKSNRPAFERLDAKLQKAIKEFREETRNG